MSWTLPNNSTLSEIEAERLNLALQAAWSIPLIRDIEGYIWETIFHYVKGIALPANSSKDLFDAVDNVTRKGWSLKTLQWNSQNPNIEFIIQRADIVKKAKELGFNEKLSEESNPEDLGRALIKHWHDKLEKDTRSQKVEEGYLTILVKSEDRKHYTFVQEPIPRFDTNDLTWAWTEPKESKSKKKKISKQDILVEAATSEQRLGLQAKSKSSGRTVLKWYIGQKQLFQSLTIPTNAPRFTITPKRIKIDSFLESMIGLLAQQKEISVIQPELFQTDELTTDADE